MGDQQLPLPLLFLFGSAAVVGEYLSFRRGSVDKAIARVVEYVYYGAEALFFDDSIFWGGDSGSILPFCREWIKIREQARQSSTPTLCFSDVKLSCQAILNLTWGAQFTVDILYFTPCSRYDVLHAMAEAGCSYLYWASKAG